MLSGQTKQVGTETSLGASEGNWRLRGQYYCEIKESTTEEGRGERQQGRKRRLTPRFGWGEVLVLISVSHGREDVRQSSQGRRGMRSGARPGGARSSRHWFVLGRFGKRCNNKMRRVAVITNRPLQLWRRFVSPRGITFNLTTSHLDTLR